MANNSEIQNPGYNTFRNIGSSEYGLLDKINFFRGIINTYNHVYQQLYTINMRKDYTELNVPVYFFLGRHDVNAPDKKNVWFDRFGHSPWINERSKYIKDVLSCFLEKEMQE